MKRITTHEEIFTLLLESFEELINDIESVNALIEENDDYDELTQFHHTVSVIRRWFNRNGNLPI